MVSRASTRRPRRSDQPDPGDPAPGVGSRASRHADVHEQSGASTIRSRASTRRPRRSTTRPWRSSAGVLGPEHPETLSSMNNLADVYWVQGKYAQAEALFSRNGGDQAPQCWVRSTRSLLLILGGFASMYQRQGKYDLAATYAAQALAGRRRTMGVERSRTRLHRPRTWRSPTYRSRKFAESETLAREALEFHRKSSPTTGNVPRREPAGRQPRGTKEIRRGRTAAARRLSGDAGEERPDRRPGPVSSGPRPRMGRTALSGLGQAPEGRGVAEETNVNLLSLEKWRRGHSVPCAPRAGCVLKISGNEVCLASRCANLVDCVFPALGITPYHQNMDTKQRQFIGRCPTDSAGPSRDKRCRTSMLFLSGLKRAC